MLIYSILPTLQLFVDATPTSETYTLSLHDALPIWSGRSRCCTTEFHVWISSIPIWTRPISAGSEIHTWKDRKSTRLNSSHLGISYAVFCLKKKEDRSKQ